MNKCVSGRCIRCLNECVVVAVTDGFGLVGTNFTRLVGKQDLVYFPGRGREGGWMFGMAIF